MAKVDLGQVVGADGKDAVIDETVTGKIASFSDGCVGMPLKSLVAEITPVQSGSGDPSPTNIRPISGRIGLTVTRAGKNLCPTQSIAKTGNSYYIGDIYNYIPFRAGTYTISNEGTAAYTYWQKEGTEDTNVIHTGYTKIGTFTLTEDCNIRIWFYTGTENPTFTDIQIEVGSTATEYEPYNATEIPITWESIAGTVYGGTLDVVSGVLTVTHAAVDMGTLTYTYDANIPRFHTSALQNMIVIPAKITIATTAITSMYKAVPFYELYSVSKENGTFAVSSNGSVSFINKEYTDAASFKTAMAGQTLCYELATPQTYRLTPTEVRTILGVNNLWSDAGDVSVEYTADTKMYIDKRLNTTQMMIAGVETSFVATKNYAIGDFVIVNDTLYRITAVITSGETITPGTNASETTVAEQFTVKNDTKGSKGDNGITPTFSIENEHLFADYETPYAP